jgi:hypothetical protein
MSQYGFTGVVYMGHERHRDYHTVTYYILQVIVGNYILVEKKNEYINIELKATVSAPISYS